MIRSLVTSWLLVLSASGVLAQQASPPVPQPTAAPAEPDYPVVRVGILSYLQYAAELENRSGYNAFDITRGYINITGQLSRNVRFRLTPDVRRVTDGSLVGTLTMRLKYGFVQFDNLTPGSSVRFGSQPTPWIDFEQSIMRYRVQGTVFAERDGLIPGSGDFGASFQVPLPGNFGDFHVGVFNGEGYTQPDANKYKSVQGRLSVRPFAGRGLATGIRVSAFVNGGWYAEDRPRHLAIVMGSFEHRHVVVAVQTLKAVERPLATALGDTDRSGSSMFVEVRQGTEGWAGLFRADLFDPDDALAGDSQRRTIVGGAYWITMGRGGRLGLVGTNEQVHYDAVARPTENRLLFQTHVEF